MDAINITNLSKVFKIPHDKSYGIKSATIGFIKRQTKYEKLYALNNINLSIKKGEFIGITGRNGSGKSTLLKIIADILKPTAGGVHVNGKISPFIELGTGFQYELTAKENIFLYGAIHGLNREEINKKLKEIIEFAELERFIDTKLKNFSSGMQARLAFSIAIQIDADILLVDEVLAVGDIGFQKKCHEVFKKFKKEGKTILLVSHSTEQLKKFSDSIIELENGVVKNN